MNEQSVDTWGGLRRLRGCVEEWPECIDDEYNPRCCRFPKSCSCLVYDPERVTESDLEDGPNPFAQVETRMPDRPAESTTDPLLAALTTTEVVDDPTLPTSHPSGRRPCSETEARRVVEIVREAHAALLALPSQWRRDQESYPDHLGGRIAAAVARLCAAELDNVLDGKPRASSGIADEIARRGSAIEAVKTLSALLAMEPGETDEKVQARAQMVLSHVDPGQSHERHVQALADARLLREARGD